MNTDDLRDGLGDEARRQPPISPDFRPGVDQRVRRQRLRAAAVATPAVILLLVVAALLVPRGPQETTVSAADGGAAGSVVPTTATSGTTLVSEAPTTASTVLTPPSLPATETTVPADPSGPASTAPTTVPPTAPPAAPAGGDCGTIAVTATHKAAVDKAPMTCFINAVNADVAATLTVVLDQGAAGSITEHLANVPGHLVSITANGSVTMKLPAFSFGAGGGSAFPTDSVPANGDCGTVTIEVGDKPSGSEMKVAQCILGAFTKGGTAHLTLVMTSPEGGSMNADLSISAEHVLSITLDGTLTMKLPAGMKVPDDLLSAIPSGKMGMGSMPGMGGFGGFGGGKTTTTTTK